MNSGYFGGSFDPIHHGHLLAAQDACEQLSLDRLFFVPTARPPLKEKRLEASVEDRVKMIQLAIGDDPRFGISDIELRRGGISYTIDTVAALREQDPTAKIIWIIGEDQVANLSQWRRMEELCLIANFACLRRPGYTIEAPPEIPGLRLTIINSRRIEISATEIRARIRENRSVRFFLPDNIINYIHERNLYRTA